MKKISITIQTTVDPARLPTGREDDPDQALTRFVHWLTSRRTDGPIIKIAMTEKTAAVHIPEPLAKQLPMLDAIASAVDPALDAEANADEVTTPEPVVCPTCGSGERIIPVLEGDGVATGEFCCQACEIVWTPGDEPEAEDDEAGDDL